MENSYGIGVKNRYALFYNEDEDPLEILKAQEAEREKKKELKLQEKENKSKGTVHTVVTKAKQQPTTNLTKKNVKDIPPVKTQEPVAPKKDENNKSRSQKPPLDRNVKFNTSPREAPLDLEERKNRRNRDERGPPPSEFRERDRGEGEIRRGGRGGGRGGRGRGRGRGMFDNRGKREFDRQSGSDKSVKPIDKREGGGSHNWGTIQDDMDEQLNNTAMSEETQEWTERPEEVPEQNEAPKVEEQVNAEPEEVKPSEEQPRQMTLDEWKKECEKNRAVPHYNLRKAGEGEDVSQWKKTYILKKKEKEEEEEEESEEDDEEEVVRRGRQKQLVEIEINFSDSRRGRGRGRGGRGGGGGGSSGGGNSGGGGGGSGGSSGGGMGGGPGLGSGTRGRMPRPERGLRTNNKTKSQSAPKVDDENDFPSLQTA